MKTKRFGFTLIELLVAVVIIGVLASISVGTYQTQMENARNNARQANVKSIYTALIMDSGDTAANDKMGGYLDSTITTAVTNTGSQLPTADRNKCYFYIGEGEEFLVIVAADKGDAYYAEGSAAAVNGITGADPIAAAKGLTCDSNLDALDDVSTAFTSAAKGVSINGTATDAT